MKSLLLTLILVLIIPVGSALALQGVADRGNRQQVDEDFTSLVDRVNRAVVQLRVESFGGGRRGSNSSLLSQSVQTGSGVFVDSTGYIVTNAHVVARAKSVEVLLAYRKPYDPEERSILRPKGDLLQAEIVGMDRETDIAVLKVEAGNQPYLRFGDSDDLRAGQRVFAFGSPLGLENSVSMGIVSSTARQLTPEDPMIYIQTDAPINPGNSGGPLVNREGEIIGINSLNLSETGGSQGLGFAAPSNIVKDIYRQIKEYGRVRRGVIGAYAQTIDTRMADALDLKHGYRVILSDVYPGSPADLVGLKPGDIVKSLDDEIMENARQLNVNIYGKTIGSNVQLTIVRSGEEITRQVKVVERNDDSTRFMELVDPERNFIDRLGVLAAEVTGKVREMLPPLRARGGILIAGSNGKSGVLGDPLKPGDVVYTANGVSLQTLQQFKQVLNGVTAGETLLLHVERNGTLRYVVHRLE